MLEYEFVQIAIGKRNCFSVSPTSAEWDGLYAFAKRQTLIGVLFSAIERLPDGQRPYLDLLMEWLGQTEHLKERNSLLDKRVAEITQLFERKGMRSCVLKGQANARLYPVPERRTPGDIDLWVEGDRKEIAKYVMGCQETYLRMQFHHIDFHVFGDVEVEVHFRPMVLFNYWKNERLQEIFRQYSDSCFKNWMPDDKHFRILTFHPDILMQLAHMYRHVFDGGVGFRQVMDYYYLLTKSGLSGSTVLLNDLRRTGLYQFAGALSYVLKTVFLADDSILLVKPDERRGAFLLKEINEGGNFGHGKIKRTHKAKSKLHNFLYGSLRNIRLLKYYPSDCAWNVIYRISQYVWRVHNGWK